MTSRTPTKATDGPPGEGLPPCFRMVVYEDRRALMHDDRHTGERGFHVAATHFKGDWMESPCGPTDARNYPLADLDREDGLITFPKSKAEADADWEKAERWVRTGELI